jgi:hypothetical protein
MRCGIGRGNGRKLAVEVLYVYLELSYSDSCLSEQQLSASRTGVETPKNSRPFGCFGGRNWCGFVENVEGGRRFNYSRWN